MRTPNEPQPAWGPREARQTLEVVWGDALIDPWVLRETERLIAEGPTPAPGTPVEVRE